MKPNRSLKLSTLIKEQLCSDLSMPFHEMFPFDITSKHNQTNRRQRVFTSENTLLTMLLTMTSEDKTLQQSVNIYSIIHKENIGVIRRESDKLIERSAKEDRKGKRGRRRTTAGRIAKSKLKEISHNTSAYTQARQRVSMEYIDDVFIDSRNTRMKSEVSQWKGYWVYLADGTYLQMQDTEAIRKDFLTSEEGIYPRGLLEVIIEQGSGIVHDFELSNYKRSELELISTMIRGIPKDSLLLADDLYSCYAIFCLLKTNKVEFIVPGKRKRKYKVVKKIGEGDELVSINNPGKSKRTNDKEVFDDELLVRRIEYQDPNDNNKTLVLYSSLINKKISKTDIILKYASRWDIEISIREVKTLMDINVVRSKTPEMARKEVYAALIAYNYLRRIIFQTAIESGFSPEGDIIQEFYEIDKPLYIDKLGRKYSRWSPGRYGYDKEGATKVFNPISS